MLFYCKCAFCREMDVDWAADTRHFPGSVLLYLHQIVSSPISCACSRYHKWIQNPKSPFTYSPWPHPPHLPSSNTSALFTNLLHWDLAPPALLRGQATPSPSRTMAASQSIPTSPDKTHSSSLEPKASRALHNGSHHVHALPTG